MEKEIKIVNDIENIITYQEITTDSINRLEVLDVEKEIAEYENQVILLNQQKTEIDEKLVILKEKIAYAKEIIKIADEQAVKIEEVIINEQIVTE